MDLTLSAGGTRLPPLLADQPLTSRDRQVRAQLARTHAHQIRFMREALAARAVKPGAVS